MNLNRFSYYHRFLLIPPLLFIAFLSISGIYFIKLSVDSASNNILALPQPKLESQIGQSSRILDSDGKLLYEIHGEIRRQAVNLSDIPDYVKNAFITAEDREFYTHPGFSLKRIISAISINLASGEIEQGGSTIPQQLAKKLVLTEEKTINRKVKELFISYFLTLRYSKDQIFERYLNEVSVGGNLVGIRTASEVYFQKSPEALTVAEGATIAALINAPSNLSPYVNKEALQARAFHILDEMNQIGYLSDEEIRAAKGEELRYAANIEPIKYPYFVFYLRDYLFNTYGKEKIENGGYTITASIDPRLQSLAESEVNSEVKKTILSWGATNASLVSIDPQNGLILAMVGGKDFSESEVNVTTSLRQPGSAIKPFVYLSAFENGYSPDTLVLDSLHDFGGGYTPHDYGGGASGSWWTIRESLIQSLNIPAVTVLQKTGLNDFIALLRRFGFTDLHSPERYGLGIALGSCEVKPIDLANGLGILANGGQKITPKPVKIMHDANGNIIENNMAESSKETVADKNKTLMVSDILSDYKTKAQFYNQIWYNNYTLKDRPAAAKTGTSEGPKDLWTVGYTPSIATVVWVGNNDGSLVNKKYGADGITVAAPLWHNFMTKALEGTKVNSFESYEKIVIDNEHKYLRAY